MARASGRRVARRSVVRFAIFWFGFVKVVGWWGLAGWMGFIEGSLFLVQGFWFDACPFCVPVREVKCYVSFGQGGTHTKVFVLFKFAFVPYLEGRSGVQICRWSVDLQVNKILDGEGCSKRHW